jgi:hypothetical protein
MVPFQGLTAMPADRATLVWRQAGQISPKSRPTIQPQKQPGPQRYTVSAAVLFDRHAHRVPMHIDQGPHVGPDRIGVLESGLARGHITLFFRDIRALGPVLQIAIASEAAALYYQN